MFRLRAWRVQASLVELGTDGAMIDASHVRSYAEASEWLRSPIMPEKQVPQQAENSRTYGLISAVSTRGANTRKVSAIECIFKKQSRSSY
jgi:hypothetical protein